MVGVLAAGALPPVFLLPLLVPAFAGLFLLTLSARNHRQAFWDGWWWGLGHFTAGLYWICISLYVEPEKFAWLTPFALFGLPSILAIYIGLVTLSLYSIRKSWSAMRVTTLIMLFTALWLTAEYARAHLFSGFPWNLIGYALNLSDITLQTASLWGIYGQSWLAVMLATLPALCWIKGERPIPLIAAGSAIVIAVIAFGSLRLANHPTEFTPVKLRLVQGNVAQHMKFDPKTALQGLRQHADLTRQPGLDAIDIVIWPETAVPYLVLPDSPLWQDLGSLLPARTSLITGGMRGEGEAGHVKAWNSLFVINAAGEATATYDKYHLVPFGEYIPLRHVLPIENIAGGMGDFFTGPGPVTLSPAGMPPFSPLICYEAIFPGKATDGTAKAQWLVNVTNDAWFGISSGPYQHLEMARVRAVEEAIPLIRVANTGISAVIDANGRVIHRLPLNKEGILDSQLPAPLNAKSIPNRAWDYIILVLISVSLCFVLLFNRLYPEKII